MNAAAAHVAAKAAGAAKAGFRGANQLYRSTFPDAVRERDELAGKAVSIIGSGYPSVSAHVDLGAVDQAVRNDMHELIEEGKATRAAATAGMDAEIAAKIDLDPTYTLEDGVEREVDMSANNGSPAKSGSEFNGSSGSGSSSSSSSDVTFLNGAYQFADDVDATDLWGKWD